MTAASVGGAHGAITTTAKAMATCRSSTGQKDALLAEAPRQRVAGQGARDIRDANAQGQKQIGGRAIMQAVFR